jgi:hypothetical protein
MPSKEHGKESPADTPVTVSYFYRVKWGFQDEFIALFRKYHYPILQEHVKSGRLVRVEIYTPRFHGDGRCDWTFMTNLVYRNWQELAASESAELAKRLYPDQDDYKKSEQRRFELVEAHWDVVLTPLKM